MLDHTDKQILEALSKNSRMTMKELGEKVHLTEPAAASRVTKFLDNGRYHASKSFSTSCSRAFWNA